MNDEEKILLEKEYRRKLFLSAAAGVLFFLILAGLYWSMHTAFVRMSRDFMSPYLNLPVKAAGAGRKIALYAAKSRTDLASALLKSEEENRYLRARNAVLENALEENRQFRELMKLGRIYLRHIRPVFSEVISRPVHAWRERFVINCGEDDGIEAGNAVLASDGRGTIAMIGQIRSVSKHTSVVATLYSEACHLSVGIPRIGEYGAMEASGGDYPVIRFLALNRKYAEGDLVLTSGISPRTPKGLPVGRIVPFSSGKILESRDRIYGELQVRPLIDPASVRTVAVCTRRKEKQQ